jgi:catechol 2,3-dioxygenase-like lactoylglutathione lyase family enzyme
MLRSARHPGALSRPTAVRLALAGKARVFDINSESTDQFRRRRTPWNGKTSRKGVHHIGLATLDMDRTLDFYTRVLGWQVAWCDIIEPAQGGRIKHAFIDSGDGTLVAFMCPDNVPGIPAEWATDIYSAQKLPPGFYHYAFNCASLEELEARREDLMRKGVDVTPVVDHE